MTQKERIRRELRRHSVTTVDAVKMHILRLSPIISLLKKEGLKIKSECVRGKSYNRYTLIRR